MAEDFTVFWSGCTDEVGGGEVLSWAHSCNRGMRVWAGYARMGGETNGIFIPLDDYYDAITFREPSPARLRICSTAGSGGHRPGASSDGAWGTEWLSPAHAKVWRVERKTEYKRSNWKQDTT